MAARCQPAAVVAGAGGAATSEANPSHHAPARCSLAVFACCGAAMHQTLASHTDCGFAEQANGLRSCAAGCKASSERGTALPAEHALGQCGQRTHTYTASQHVLQMHQWCHPMRPWTVRLATIFHPQLSPASVCLQADTLTKLPGGAAAGCAGFKIQADCITFESGVPVSPAIHPRCSTCSRPLPCLSSCACPSNPCCRLSCAR